MEDEGSTKTLIRVLRSRERAMQHVTRPSAIDRDGAINERATNSSRKASRARTDKIADRERRAAFASSAAGSGSNRTLSVTRKKDIPEISLGGDSIPRSSLIAEPSSRQTCSLSRYVNQQSDFARG